MTNANDLMIIIKYLLIIVKNVVGCAVGNVWKNGEFNNPDKEKEFVILLLAEREKEKKNEKKNEKEGCFYERVNEKKNWGNTAFGAANGDLSVPACVVHSGL